MRPFGGSPSDDQTLAVVRAAARPWTDLPGDPGLERLLGGARAVLLGEASHGSDEFYRVRADITRALIERHGCAAIAVEADWPDAYRVDRYVRGLAGDRDADAALDGFRRFPTWMWRNTVVREFVEWLRGWNAARPPAERVGFHGLDLYSLYASIDAVLEFLGRVDPEAAKRARYRYACFDHFRDDTQAYGYAAHFGLEPDCEAQVRGQLGELIERRADDAAGDDAAELAFQAEQNARLVKNAEAYYRAMFGGRVASWNLRDRHMAETLVAVEQHVGRRRGEAAPRVAVWAHNSHLGDARATEMSEGGELNLGQLVRERLGDAAALVGFSTHHGSVTAASDWDRPGETKTVQPGLPGSCEALFHAVGCERFALVLHGDPALARAFAKPRLQRAIGVVYRPQSERISHYFETRLAEQFDAVIHLDETTALEALPTREVASADQEGAHPSPLPLAGASGD